MASAIAEGIPTPSLVETSLHPTHYWDAYSVAVAPGTFGTVDRLARTTTRLSTGGKALMATRNFVVRPFGLVTGPEQVADGSDLPLQTGSAVGIFTVLERSSDEILMGMNDKHLDFRFSLILRKEPNAERAIATTLVRFHNAGGRIYFAFVKPIHRLLVPVMLRMGAARARRAAA